MKQDQTHPMATVLVVDDDPGARLLVGSALEVAGFRVVTAADGKSAIAEFQAHPADCVLLDVVMPGMSGFDVCRELRASPSSRHVAILMQTSLDDNRSVQHAYKAGAPGFYSLGFIPILLAENASYDIPAKASNDHLRP